MFGKFLYDDDRPTDLSWEDENPASYNLDTGILRSFEEVKAEYDKRNGETSENEGGASTSDIESSSE